MRTYVRPTRVTSWTATHLKYAMHINLLVFICKNDSLFAGDRATNAAITRQQLRAGLTN